MDIFGPVWDNYIDSIVSDWKERVSDEDVVLIAGDISWAMKLEDAKPDLDFISSLPGKKIIIRGNHDYWWKSISSVRSLLGDNFFALQNDHVTLDNIIFCGTRGWQVPERNPNKEDEKIYKREVMRLQLSLESAKKEQKKTGFKIVCLMHYPPFNSRLQESEFTKLFKKYEVNAVVYGHLHGTNCRNKGIIEIASIPYYLTSCDQVKNKLVEINI
jgi:predicted phosphohydrolase